MGPLSSCAYATVDQPYLAEGANSPQLSPSHGGCHFGRNCHVGNSSQQNLTRARERDDGLVMKLHAAFTSAWGWEVE